MSTRTKLELTWIGKENRPKLEPRILLEDSEKSHHAAHRVTNHDLFDNRLIFGDNLLALKALEQEFAGKVKCVYIDPPYNTGSAFAHYDDSIEHSLWLTLIQARLEILWRLLSADGSLWISIDDDEMPYLRVLMDQLIGRDKFLAQNVWQKRYSRENREAIGDVHEYVVVYAKDPVGFKERRNKIPLTDKQAEVYKNPNADPKGRWRPIPMTAQEGHATAEQFYEIVAPSGRVFVPSEGRCWSLSVKTFERLRAEGRIWFGKDGNSQPNVIRYLSEVEGIVPWTWWPSDEVGHTDQAKKEIHALFGKVDAFDTPKPERLMHRILAIATNPGDLVLDSFAGSGTTGAVAHKMGRRWIMTELGEHCHSLVVPRLKKVIDGEDPGGVTEAVEWRGGGGFRYFRLAPSLLEKDKWDQWVVSRQFNGAMLAEAVCKLESFVYAPPGDDLWLQYLRDGHSVVIGLGPGGIEEQRLENYVVMGLIDFDDVSYDVNAEVLFDLAGQVVRHLRSNLSEDDVKKVLRYHLRAIAKMVYVQMQPHYWEEPAAGYEVKVTQGFVELKASAYSSFEDESVRDFRQAPEDKSNMARYLFGNFERCLYSVQRFQSDSERRFAVILDRETSRWFKPTKGQFRIHYRQGSDLPEYLPDFVAETDQAIWMLEVKMKSEMASPEVLAKKQAAEVWCGYASDHAKTCGGKPWRYALIAHDVITANMSLASLVA